MKRSEAQTEFKIIFQLLLPLWPRRLLQTSFGLANTLQMNFIIGLPRAGRRRRKG